MLTVTVALPLEVPLQFASVIAVTVYVVDDDGETLREAVVPLFTVCTLPSDQVTENGATPVRVAVTVADPAPAQMVPPPLTAAVDALWWSRSSRRSWRCSRWRWSRSRCSCPRRR